MGTFCWSRKRRSRSYYSKGKNLLEQADVIIYAGSLVNPQLLDNAKKECEIHNSAYMTLEEVIEVMKDAWERNLDVVRLHTGEPEYIWCGQRADGYA